MPHNEQNLYINRLDFTLKKNSTNHVFFSTNEYLADILIKHQSYFPNFIVEHQIIKE